MDDYFKYCPKGVELSKEIEKVNSITNITLNYFKENMTKLERIMEENFKQLNDKIDTSNKDLSNEFNTKIENLEKKVDANNLELTKKIDGNNSKLDKIIKGNPSVIGEEIEKKWKFGTYGVVKWGLMVIGAAGLTAIIKILIPS